MTELFEDNPNIKIRDNIVTIMQADGTKESFLIDEIKNENQVAYYLIPLNEYISAHIFGDNDDANDVCNENENQWNEIDEKIKEIINILK